jgi:hypothetical protein
MINPTAKKNSYDKTSTKRQTSFLDRLKEGGGGSVRIDFQGPDLKKLDELVACENQGSRAEVVRELVRNAKVKMMKK